MDENKLLVGVVVVVVVAGVSAYVLELLHIPLYGAIASGLGGLGGLIVVRRRTKK